MSRLWPNTGERNAVIIDAVLAGKTYREVGAMYGVSGARVRQICKRVRVRSTRSPVVGGPDPDQEAIDELWHRRFLGAARSEY